MSLAPIHLNNVIWSSAHCSRAKMNKVGQSIATGRSCFVAPIDYIVANKLQDQSIIAGAARNNAAHAINALTTAENALDQIAQLITESLCIAARAKSAPAARMPGLKESLHDNIQRINNIITSTSFDDRAILCGEGIDVDLSVGLGIPDTISCKIPDISQGKLFRHSAAQAINEYLSADLSRIDGYTTQEKLDEAIAQNVNFVTIGYNVDEDPDEDFLTTDQLANAFLELRSTNVESFDNLYYFITPNNTHQENWSFGRYLTHEFQESLTRDLTRSYHNMDLNAVSRNSLLDNLTSLIVDQLKQHKSNAEITGNITSSVKSLLEGTGMNIDEVTEKSVEVFLAFLEEKGGVTIQGTNLESLEAYILDDNREDLQKSLINHPQSLDYKNNVLLTLDMLKTASNTIKAIKSDIVNKKDTIINYTDSYRKINNTDHKISNLYLNTNYIAATQEYKEQLAQFAALMSMPVATNKLATAVQEFMDNRMS